MMFVILGDDVSVNMDLAETVEVEENAEGIPARIAFYLPDGNASWEPFSDMGEARKAYKALMSAYRRGQDVFSLEAQHV